MDSILVSGRFCLKNCIMDLEERLKLDEGFSRFPYADSVGKLSIGWGRNLTEVGITQEEAEMLLRHDLVIAKTSLVARFPVVGTLNLARQNVLYNMNLNMGIVKLAKFNHMWLAIEAGDYEKASIEMLDSLWARQVGSRAERLAREMETGVEE